MVAINKQENQLLGVYRAWLSWLFSALFYCYQFVLRVSPNVMTDDLMRDFSIDASSLSVLIAFYYYAYAGMQLPLGVTMDLFGPRRILTVAGFICALACFVMATATSPAWIALARFMTGLGSACVFLGACKLATLWFRPKQLGLVIGLTFALGTIGAALIAPLEILISYTGWRYALNILGVIGVIIGLCILIVTKNAPPGQSSSPYKPEPEETHILSGLLQVILTPQAWIIALFGMLMFTPLPIIGELWGVSFIEKVYGVDEKIAATVIAAMFIGIAVGSPAFAMLSDRLTKRRTPMILGASVTLVLYLIIILVYIPLPLMYVLFFLAGFFFTGQCLCFASICEIMPLAASGVAVGFTNMVIMFSGVIAHPLVGRLLDYSWKGQIVDGVPFYSADDLRFALLLIPVCLGLALLLANIIRETYPTRHH